MIYYVMTVIQVMGNSKKQKNIEKFAAYVAKENKKNGKPLPKITDELWRLRLTK